MVAALGPVLLKCVWAMPFAFSRLLRLPVISMSCKTPAALRLRLAQTT